jgi:alkylation response protein AidB-like acyl-CoA dehydrogenase
MGIHGNATCVMNYDGATGSCWARLHKGMRAMFTMMNEARWAWACRAMPWPRSPIRTRRLCPRPPAGPRGDRHQNPDGPADPLIVHPDIRRTLMDQKSFVEGARAFTLWGASLIDRAHRNG